MNTELVPESCDIFGVPVSHFTSYEHAEALIMRRIRARLKTFCVAITPRKIYYAQHDEALRCLLGTADIHICDGSGTAAALRLIHNKRVTRITGVQLFFNLIACAASEGLRVFLLGASPESNKGAATNLAARYPDLQIVGTQDGYFAGDDGIVRAINISKADMVFVAMGSPRQEHWISRNRGDIDAPLCMGIGGTLDVASGHARRAPAIFRRTGTEFLFRLLADPRRLRRQTVLPKFAATVLAEKIQSLYLRASR